MSETLTLVCPECSVSQDVKLTLKDGLVIQADLGCGFSKEVGKMDLKFIN